MCRSLEDEWRVVATSLLTVINQNRIWLQDRLSEVLKAEKSGHDEITGLKESLSILQSEFLKANARRSYLDCQKLDEMACEDVIGEHFIQAKAKAFRMTPNITVSLTAKYPIRKFECAISSGAIWKWKTCPLGQFTFQGLVKTKPFKDALVRVKLFGWRNEIYREEIESLTRKISELSKTLLSLPIRISSMATKLEELKRSKEGWTNNIAAGERDRIKIEAFQITGEKEETVVHKCIEVGSVSSVAKLLMLELEVQMALIHTNPRHSSVHGIVKTFRENGISTLNDLKMYMTQVRTARQELEKINTGVKCTMMKVGGSKSSLDSSVSKMKSRGDMLIAVSSSKDGELATAAMMDLQRLEQEMKEILEIIVEREETSQKHGNDALLRNVSPARPANDYMISRNVEMTEIEIKAGNAAEMQLSKDPYPIGVMAALCQYHNAEEVWYSIYQGEKIQLLHDKGL